MPNKHAKLDDMKEKLQDAKRAAHKPGASAREKADLKLMEQEVAAARLKAKRPTKKEDKPRVRGREARQGVARQLPGQRSRILRAGRAQGERQEQEEVGLTPG